MKTKAILILVCVGLLTSCAGKFSVMKRRYNKGYYVSHSGDRKQQLKPEARKNERLNRPETTTPETFAKSVFKRDPDLQPGNRVVNALPASENVISQHPGLQEPRQQREKETFASTRDLSTTRHEIMALSQLLIGAKKDLVNSGSDSDVNLVLLVILAILIPPLAVYLKNKSIDKWFWITLILSLLGFMGLFFVYGGLFWLAAVVIAILYVLDAL